MTNLVAHTILYRYTIEKNATGLFVQQYPVALILHLFHIPHEIFFLYKIFFKYRVLYRHL